MKFIKKAISAILASVMCIPSGIISVAHATETSTDGSYTVTLTDTQNGIMQFSEECMVASTASQDGYHLVTFNEDGEMEEAENDGTIWAFSKGDTVEIQIIPDDGYEVSSFAIKNASTGGIMSQQETNHNVFSFDMPAKNVAVETVLAEIFEDSDEFGEGAGEVSEENNVISTNENGDIVYERLELVDDEAVSLQERINNLPASDELYNRLFIDDEEDLVEDKEEIDAVADIYFNQFSDEQRAQIDSALLFADLLIISASDNVATFDTALSDAELQKVQERIYNLALVPSMTEEAEVNEENHLIYDYQSNANMFISNEEQDALFLEVLDLSTTVFNSLTMECRSQLVIEPLEYMYEYFTLGFNGNQMEVYAESMESTAYADEYGIMPFANTGSGSDITSSADHVYVGTYHPEHHASWFEGECCGNNILIYCANAGWPAASHSGYPTVFEHGTPLEQIELDPEISSSVNVVRACLYFGFGAPGQAEGIDTIAGGRSDLEKYMITHYALSIAYSNDPGTCGKYDYKEDIDKFIEFCTNHQKEVPKPPEFEVLLIHSVRPGKYQNLFYFKSNLAGSTIKKRDPFNIFLYKINDQDGFQSSNATLAGAQVTVILYGAEDNGGQLFTTFADIARGATKATATFVFQTMNYDEADMYWPNAEAKAGELQDKMHQSGSIKVGVIETGPDPDSLLTSVWTNKYLVSASSTDPDVIDAYSEFWGTAGTYVVKETLAPFGFQLAGEMYALDEMGTDHKSSQTTQLTTGVIVTVDEDANITVYNGLSGSGTGGTGNIGIGMEGNAELLIAEKPNTPRLWTNAIAAASGNQFVDKDNTATLVKETINVQTISGNENCYTIKTALYDLTAKQYIPIKLAKTNSYGKPNIGPGWTFKFEDTNLTFCESCGTAFNNCTPIPVKDSNGNITHYIYPESGGSTSGIEVAFDTRTGVEPGQTATYELNVQFSTVGLEGHTLVFENHMLVQDGFRGAGTGGVTVNGADGQPVHSVIYQYPMNPRPGSDSNGDPKNLMELDEMRETIPEMIFVTNSDTSILSTQTKRKGGAGESIIYAGMYQDGTFTSGHGAIQQNLTDTINYSNLQPNRTYYVKGYLMDVETGNYAVDANGTPIQNTQNTIMQQASDSGSGSWQIEYTFDATGCGNRKYVSFVDVYLDDQLVMSYRKLDDPMESFYIPEITTKLWDDKTGVDLSYAEEMVSVHDTIKYYKFLPNTRYRVDTRLVNMETGETLLDVNGDPVERTQIVQVNSVDGEIVVDIDFPAVIRDEKGDIVKSLAGTIFVAYEKVYIEQEYEGSEKWVLVACHDDFWDKDQRIYMPYIDTTALDQKTEEHISYAEKNMKIYDTVHYEAIRPEYTYRLVSELIDVATGEIVVDNAGKKQVLTTYFKADFDLQDNQYLTYGDIIPQNHDGSGITFDLDAEYFAGRTFVVYERLYLDNEYGSREHLIAEHQVLLDEQQTIHVPKIWTSAIDSDTFTKTSFADGSTTIIDTISYENLIPGFTYELKGYVIDKNASIQIGSTNPVVAAGSDGRLAENSVIFTPNASSGAVKLSFEVDTRKFGTEDYNGMIFVVYEELYVIQRYDGDDARSIVARHTDIADLNQTIYVPRITTSLVNKKTGTKVLYALEDAHLVDTVSYYRFQPNTEYVVKGKLVDMETGTILIDSKGKRVEKTVDVMTSDSGTGEWKIDYEFDATELAGKVIVAYADVYVRNGERNDILSHVASHNDFWDEEQRVYIPSLSTVATDQKTNSHITFAEENVWVTDRVYYSHLQPNTEYKLISKLIDKDTGEVVVDDKGIEQIIESTFTTTPNESQERYNQIITNPFDDSSNTGVGYSYGYIIPADGTTLPDGTPYRGIVFTFDAHTFEGRTLVVYEELQMRTADDGYMTIADHMDINDENQTVHIPKLRTNAVDSETLTHSAKMDGSMTIIDTVSYENLIPGFTYVLEGYLMDKPRDDTKGYGRIKDADGNYITNRIEFTPDKPDGEVKISLSGDASKFKTDEGEFSSETIVVFERLYLKNNKDASDDLLIVANHEDITDENQTIYCPRITTKVVAYDLGEEPKEGEADHVIGFTAYECSYCKKKFYTELEAQTHLDTKGVACRNFGGVVNTVTEATIYDTVYYENLIPNRTYCVVGHLIDATTGKAVLINQRAVQSEEKYFTPGDANGEVDVVFHVTGVNLAGGKYVVYEEIFLNGTSIAEHKDITDKNQTFYVIHMSSSAIDNDTKAKISKNDTISTIIDTIEVSGLKENEKYYINSTIMDISTDESGAKVSNYGSNFIDATGKVVQPDAWRKKGETVWHNMDEPFTLPSTSANSYSGRASIEVKFTVDTRTTNGGKNFQGMTYVLFQELRLENGEIVAQHKDLADTQQTIRIGGLYTIALDTSVDGTQDHLMDGTAAVKIGEPKSGLNRTLTDYIYYTNLERNATYYVRTNVFVKELSKGSDPTSDVMFDMPVANADILEGRAYTTTSTGAGVWAVNISLDNAEIQKLLDNSTNGITLVVYEEIRKGGIDGERVVLEDNLYNEMQSVHIPKISTSEADDVNGLHYTLSEHKWICDNAECVVYTCDGCKKEFHSEAEAADHLYDCRQGSSYTCTSGIFDSKAEAEMHIAPIYQCDNCEAQFRDEADAIAHVSGECRDAVVLRATQLVRNENGEASNELWYACSGCGMQFKTNAECLEHIEGSDVCYTYTNINAEHYAFHNVNASITDTVSFANVIPGKTYRVDGWIYDTETKLPAVGADGNEITASVTFSPMTSMGNVALNFQFDATVLEGHKYAVYAELKYIPSKSAQAVVISTHNAELNKKAEEFYIPSVSTSAVDYYTKTNVTRADSTTQINDTVTYSGLNTTDTYVIEGIIMDAETMQPLVFANGGTATATSGNFRVNNTTDNGRGYGEKTLTFTFSTSDLEGKTLVVFEKLYLIKGNEKVLIGQHTEIMDENQTTHVPMMRTYAYDQDTKEQVSGADDSVTLIDKVIMTNLVPGKRYKLEATLVDPNTGMVIQDANGHDITGVLDMYENQYNEFTASTSGRTVRTVKFVFDGSNLAGRTAVIHEKLYMEDVAGSFSVIAQHNPLPNANDAAEDFDYLNQRIDFPAIRTSERDATTHTKFTKDNEFATIIDTVTYKNLTPGLEYKLVGTIYDVKHDVVLTDTFNNVFTSTVYFTPKTSEGTVDMEFTFNTREMAGNTYVVFEELFLNDVSIATHKDPNDLEQTFKIPTIGTSTMSEDIGLKMTMADDDAVIIDTVTFTNLIADEEYTVKGILMDKATGKPLLDHYGDEITGETTFRPTTANGTVEVQFRFNASDMEGIIAVAYEELFYMDASIAEHKDIDDEEQTIYFPKVWSLAQGNETDMTHVGPADAIMTITDTVYYENLIGDREYHIEGVVIDVATGKPALDANGDEVREHKRFTTAHPDADSASKAVSGSEDVIFTFDATGMRGKTLVIYEYIYYHKTTTSYLDYKVGEHAVLDDEEQMIHIPEIGTTAWDSETRTHLTKADDNATIIDTVAYKNLYPGLEYTLEAYLIDLDEGGEQAVDDYGLPIQGRTTFIPKDWEGTVDVRFGDLEITSLAGHTLVAYEFLYYKGTLIEHHDNPEDEAQTIHIPMIATHARSFESDSHNAGAMAYVNVVDEIEYWNLIPGLEYSVIGVVVNKATGQPAIDADNHYIMGSTTFTPDTADGTVDVVFTFNSTGMEGTDLVVFEEIFYQGNLAERKSIAEHSDMEDEEQSVSIPKIATRVIDTKTDLKLALAEEDMVIKDIVAYKGLYPDTEYEIVGKLYDVETKQPALDDNGNEIVGSVNFTTDEKMGFVEVPFTFSGKTLEGHTLAVQTELFVVMDGQNMASVTKIHNEDLSDVDEMLYIPKARTTVVDNETSINYSKVDNKVTITDTIKYENLVPGFSYTASGVLVDRETGEPVKDVNGNEITAEAAFVVREPDGTIDIEFVFDATGFDGLTYNVFETITCNGKVVAEHKDPNDEEQNIHFPKLSSEAVDVNSELQLTLAEKSAMIDDIIYYENLKPGEEYVIEGYLYDKTTGLPILDPSVNVNPYEVLEHIIEHWTCDQCGKVYDNREDALAHVNASTSDTCDTFTLVLSFDMDEYKELIESATMKVSTTFIPSEATGHETLTYEIDASSLAGHTIVAFAKISYKGVVLVTHEDINDEAETIYIPKIGTTATDAESGLHVSRADGSVTIIDVVEYENLVTGMNYVMMGYLIDKATGETLVDANGDQVYAETEFQPLDPNGTVEVTFQFDGSNLAGSTLVAYEYLAAQYKDLPIIAKHEDIEDEEQTIKIPEIGTKAFDSITNENVVKADSVTKIIDRVYYHNLDINQTYTISGVLIDKATGSAIIDASGNEVRAEKTFMTRDHDGYVDVEFVFDATEHTGKTLVVFEELFLKGYSIAKHENPDDEDQTVYIPKVSTTALDQKTSTHMAYADDKITIVDKVSYSNVSPNTSYTMVGTLVDGETGKVLVPAVKQTFTAEAENGFIEMIFEVDATSLKGKKVVVYEELQTKFAIKVTETETYVCNQCGRVYADKHHAVWHFEDSEKCYDYTVNFEQVKEYGDYVTVAEHKDITDVEQTVYVPEIHTTAKDAATNVQLTYAGNEAVVIDTIHYKGVQAGLEYEVVGTLMDKETGKAVQVNGKDVTASAKFTAESTEGTVDVEFRFDATLLAGHSLVAYEKLYVDGRLIADHEDLEDKDQTVYVPSIGTTATDANTNEHIGSVGATRITDVVEYHNLISGYRYTVKGTLMNKTTGEAYGEGYTAETSFIAEKADGTVTLTFEVDAIEDTSIVVFEELYYNNSLIGEHKDINDEDQTVQYPKIRTHATNKETGDKVVPSTGKAVIVDTVTYTNLIVGKKYTINGELMDKETGKSTGYTATVTFVAEKPDGEVKLEFEVDASLLAGKSIVAFEHLLYEGKELTNHTDLTDEDQTVDIPEIRTHASDEATQTHVVSLGDKVVITDVVTYKNLTPGIEYTMKGTLMLKGEDGVTSTGITEEVKFTPSEKNGSVELKFVIDSTKYAGEALVAYEKLFDKDVEITRHENPDDEDQTVYVPNIGTKASFENGKKTGKNAKDTVIIDTVAYTNLVPGMSYTMYGKLMDKATGKALSVGDEPIMAVKAFTPESPNGTVELTFKFDATNCGGMSIVVFEDLVLNDVLVATHSNINDEAQTVGFPEIATHAVDEGTGTKVVTLGDKVTVLDVVTYKNLTPGVEYTMSGELMLKTSDGVKATGIKTSAKFTPTEMNGTVTLKFTVDSTKYAGQSLVAFETLFEHEVEIADHKNPDDEDQTVYVPEIRTKASVGGEKNVNTSTTTAIIDTVTYKNLVPGVEYKMSGVLMDKTTKKEVSINGKAVTAEVVFTPTSADGKVEMKFLLDSTSLAGHSAVVFEELTVKDKVVAIHKDIDDEDQTVNFNKPNTPDKPDNPDTPDNPDEPSIRTNASINGVKTAVINNETVIVDTVTYKNLTVGKEYTLKGKLVNKANGKTLASNGKAITSEITFIPKEANGSIEMKFTFNSSNCAGMSIVVFESLYLDNKLVVKHEDINDEDQTVTFEEEKETDKPSIRTHASINGSKEAKPSKEIVVVDKVSYKNLKVGTQYTLKGKLMDKATGNEFKVDGKTVTSEVKFTPSKADGEIEMTFKFDGSNLKDTSLVVYEYLYISEVLIADHADINDEDQTVKITENPNAPSIQTNASIDGKKSAVASKSTVIVDKVTYKNLTPNKEYTLKGKLVNKANGNTLSMSGTPITAELKFTPTSADGSVELKFTLDTSSCAGMEIVVYEYLYLGETLVASHADINDENQTVTITDQSGNPVTPGTQQPNTSTTPNTSNNGSTTTKVRTGDEYGLIVAVFVATVAILGAAIVLLKRKRQ